MKKIIVSLIAVIAAFSLSSCMGGAGTNTNTVDAAVKANEALAMDAEKAAGVYALESMDVVSGAEYTANSITLNADGTFVFNVVLGETESTQEGTYSIGTNGTITFGDGFAIVAKGETVVCNGEKLAAEGQLGRTVVTMNYDKKTEEELAAMEEAEIEAGSEAEETGKE